MTGQDEGQQGKAEDVLYNVTIEGPGVDISQSIPAERLPSLLAVVLGTWSGQLPSDASGGGLTPAGMDPEGRPGRTPAEFLNATQASTNAERIAAFAWYKAAVAGENGVHRDDLPELFRDAHESVPANMSRDINKAKKAGLIGEDPDEEDLFYITATGKETLKKGEK